MLYKLGGVKNFQIYKAFEKKKYKHYITFTVLFYRNSPFFSNIKLVSSQSKNRYITLKALRILNHSIGSTVIILSSSKGLITHKDALRFGIGGKVLAVLY